MREGVARHGENYKLGTGNRELGIVNDGRNPIRLEFLITNFTKPAPGATGGLFMRAGEGAFPPGEVHFVEQGKQFPFELGGVVNLKGAVRIFDQPMGGAFAIRALDEQAVCGDLKNVGVVGRGGGAPGFDFDRDQKIGLLHQVVGFSGQTEPGIVEGFFDLRPAARVGVDDPPARETGLFLLPVRQPEEDKGEEEGDEEEGKHGGGRGNVRELGGILGNSRKFEFLQIPTSSDEFR